MGHPEFVIVATPEGQGVTYSCGCPCQPTARPAVDGSAGHEHCCCGKVHFVGADAGSALALYLEERKARRKREPDYEIDKRKSSWATLPSPLRGRSP